jgi:hypothetical protein
MQMQQLCAKLLNSFWSVRIFQLANLIWLFIFRRLLLKLGYKNLQVLMVRKTLLNLTVIKNLLRRSVLVVFINN